MNIFSVLSQGKGRLDEENLSAMLGYLLNPKGSHGFGDLFLREFLSTVSNLANPSFKFDDLLSSSSQINADVFFEEPYRLKDKERRIDIEVRICDKDKKERYRVAIENKIRKGAANPEQFREEFEGIYSDIKGEENLKLIMVFLTPPEHEKMKEEYDSLRLDMLTESKTSKAWLTWIEKDAGHQSVCSILKNILQKEHNCEINPIDDYVKQTFRALIRHISEDKHINEEPLNQTRKEYDIGEQIESLDVEISAGHYRIERYETGSVRVFNKDTEEYETAKDMLKQINEEKGLGIPKLNKQGYDWNTREWGKKVLNKLRETDLKK